MMEDNCSEKNFFPRLRDRLVDFLVGVEPRVLIAVGVIFAVIFSEIIVFIIGILWSGRMSRELLFAGFLTPLLDAFLILTFFVAIIARLKAVEARFAAFMKYMPGMAFLKRSSGEFVYANEAWERVFHVKGTDICGKRDEDLWPENIAAQCKRNDKTVIETKIPLQFMQPVPQDDGLHNWYTIKFPVPGDSGRVVMVGGIGIDVTDRKKAEDELKNHREHLEELVAQRSKELATLNEQLRQSQKLEAIGILAGGIAHEFSNILTAMKGSAYIMQKKLNKESPLMKYAEQILSSIGKANNLSHGLLAFSRKQTISLTPIHFNKTISRISNLLVRLIGEHIELQVIPSERDITVMADPNQIEQVLVNLVTNARDAMPDGGKLTIRTGVMEMSGEFIKGHGYGIPGKYAALAVTDTGTGMEEGVRQKIFQPFFTTKMVGKGSGLGLAVTYGIVRQHNGFIDAESVPGKGTTFTIYLPVVETEAIHCQGRGSSPVNPGVETILLAEDDPDTRTIVSSLLEMTGYDVLVAGDGEDAMKVVAEKGDMIRLVLLDVRMPRKNGREAYDEIRKLHPAMKFLFMSGYTADIIDSYGIKEEGLNFISKTALPEEILAKVREILDDRGKG